MPNEKKHCVLCGGTGHSSHQCPWTKKAVKPAVKPTKKRKEREPEKKKRP
jgi:hypothetical protein